MMDPLIFHRMAHTLWRWRIPVLPGILHRLNYVLTHCDLPPAVRIGRAVVFKHWGSGVVVHHRAEIGDRVIIHPQVVIGQRAGPRGAIPLESLSIGMDTVIGAGACILASGRFSIGAHAAVGAGSVVLESIADGVTVVGIPARPSRPRSS